MPATLRRARRCVADLTVRLVHRVTPMHQHGHGPAGVHREELAPDVLVRAGLDQVDMMTLVRDAQLSQTKAHLHRAQRERVVVELELGLVRDLVSRWMPSGTAYMRRRAFSHAHHATAAIPRQSATTTTLIRV